MSCMSCLQPVQLYGIVEQPLVLDLNAINASSVNVLELTSPVYVFDSFGHARRSLVQQQTLTFSSAYACSISNRPSVLDSTWGQFTSSAMSVSLFLNDTITGKFAHG
mmetsp:Transcript_22435/g.73673  ORF Transcript_22435/g.73673 Transcript_22435/m.73673 type:complete len:107 (-) Transcript_22435:1728-2048(-)